MKPGQRPASARQAREMVAEYRVRFDAALDPYADRAFNAQLYADDQARETGAEGGLEEVAPQADLGKSLKMAALVELMTDMLHYCDQHGIRYVLCQQAAVEKFGDLKAAATRFLVYENPDEDEDKDGGDLWLTR